jgi:trk system potassium uptake protein TrkH
VIANAVAFIRSRNETVVFGRRLDEGLVKKASAIICVSFSVTFVFLLLLLLTNDVNSVDAAYEIFSATATVGLSRGLTPTLNSVGKILVIICMYLGRIGPISMALFFNYRGAERNKVKYTKGNFFAG